MTPGLIFCLICLYFLPTALGAYRRLDRLMDLFMFNLCLGFLPPVWLALLIVAIVE